MALQEDETIATRVPRVKGASLQIGHHMSRSQPP